MAPGLKETVIPLGKSFAEVAVTPVLSELCQQQDHCSGHQLSKRLGPAGCLAAGGASPTRQKDHWLLVSSGTHSRFPAPGLHPSQTFVTAPHSENVTTLRVRSVLAEAVCSTDNRQPGVGRGSERLPCPAPASRQNYARNVFLEPGLA